MKEPKRLFAGIPISARIQSDLYKNLMPLQKTEDKAIRWIPMENYHITLHFIRSTPPEQVEQIRMQLSRNLAGISGFILEFTEYVFFPIRNPYMIWARAAENAAFDTLQKKIQDIFQQQPKVSKPAIPHITLARFKNPKLTKKIALPILASPLALSADSVVLWESTLTPTGAVYHEISKISLRYGDTSHS